MNWNNITIGQYQEIHKIKASGLELLSIALNMTVEDLEELSARQLKMLTDEMSFLNDEPNGVFAKSWMDYKILDFKSEGSGGNMIDFLALLDSGDYIQNLHFVMATICSKKNDLPFEEKSKYIQERMPITIALGIANFFFQYFNLSKQTIPFYLEQVKKGKVNPQTLWNKILEMDLSSSINGKSGLID